MHCNLLNIIRLIYFPLFVPRVNPNPWSPGQRMDSPWTQRGWTSAALKETASCLSVPLREKTQEYMRCLWRWRTLRTRLHSLFKLLVSIMSIFASDRGNMMTIMHPRFSRDRFLYAHRAAGAPGQCKDCGYLGLQCCSGVDPTHRQRKHRDHRLHGPEGRQKDWSK